MDIIHVILHYMFDNSPEIPTPDLQYPRTTGYFTPNRSHIFFQIKILIA